MIVNPSLDLHIILQFKEVVVAKAIHKDGDMSKDKELTSLSRIIHELYHIWYYEQMFLILQEWNHHMTKQANPNKLKASYWQPSLPPR